VPALASAPDLPIKQAEMSDDRPASLYCLLTPAAAGALEAVQEHYRSADPRVRVIVDRRAGERRRPSDDDPKHPERRGAPDRRRFVVPRVLPALPAALGARTGPVTWIQRMLPVGPVTEALETPGVVAAVRARDAEAPTELYWRCYQRMHSRLSVRLGDERDVDATVVRGFGRVLDALEDRARDAEPFEELLYAEVDAAADAVLERREQAHGVPPGGLEVADPRLEEPVTIVDPDPMWPSRARQARDRVRELLAGADVVAIEHVGSTVLPDVAGRDTLDLVVGLRALPADPSSVAALVRDGFEDCGDAGTPGRHHLRRREHPSVDLHLVVHGEPLWTDAVGLRDWLLRHSLEAQRWSDVKRAAGRHAPGSTSRYHDLRRLALEELLERARAEALTRS
jgi:GrpB-like predicted nucleotidyltransferase (UPF0157 family)